MAIKSNLSKSEIKKKPFASGCSPDKNDYKPGDILLTHGKAWTSYLIRFGQSLRYWGEERKYTWWSHAALIVESDGTLIEAIGSGVHKGNISDYNDAEYILINIDSVANDHDRAQVVGYAKGCVGQRYGYLTILGISLNLLVLGKIIIGIDGQKICSGLVARALERTGAVFECDPARIMPADLAFLFKADPTNDARGRGTLPGGFRIKEYIETNNSSK